MITPRSGFRECLAQVSENDSDDAGAGGGRRPDAVLPGKDGAGIAQAGGRRTTRFGQGRRRIGDRAR